MSNPSEKLGVSLYEAMSTLNQLIMEFNTEKFALKNKNDEVIAKLNQELEDDKSKLRAMKLAFEAKEEISNVPEEGGYMIFAIDLSIEWSGVPEYWAWTTVPESRHVVAELLRICRLDISYRLSMEKLSPQTNYASYLVYKFKEDSRGFKFPPGEAYAGIAGVENSISKTYLVPEGDQDGSERADRYPLMRSDGWMEVELGEFFIGEFFIDEFETFGEIEMGFKEVSNRWKKGLIVQGIVVRPKQK